MRASDFCLNYDSLLYLPLWMLDGDGFADRSVYGHRSSVIGALWTPQGRKFDGVDDRISLPTDANLNSVAGTGQETVLAWIKTSNNAKPYQGILSAGNAGAGSPIPYDFYLETGKLRFQVYNGGWLSLTADTQVANDVWYHAAATFVSGSTCLLYLNASLDKSDTIAKTLAASTYANNGVGADGSGGSPFAGVIGEVVLHNRIMTPLEIQHHYMATKWRYQ